MPERIILSRCSVCGHLYREESRAASCELVHEGLETLSIQGLVKAPGLFPDLDTPYVPTRPFPQVIRIRGERTGEEVDYVLLTEESRQRDEDKPGYRVGSLPGAEGEAESANPVLPRRGDSPSKA
jgi:hypothetical protein